MNDLRHTAPTPQVQRLPLNQQVLRALRHDVMYGVLAPGTRLTQGELCDRYRTSRMPVRDAMRELVQIGLLTEEDNQVVVPLLSRADLQDVYSIQGSLHGMACSRLALRDDRASTVADLRELITGMEMAEQGFEHRRMAELNWQFHTKINMLGGSRPLRATMRAVAGYTPRDFAVEFPDSMHRSNEEHVVLVDAIEAGDADLAHEVAAKHVVAAGADYITYYTSMGLRLADH